MSKTTEALKRVLSYVEQTAQFIPHDLDDEGIVVAALIREALADHIAEADKMVAEPVQKAKYLFPLSDAAAKEATEHLISIAEPVKQEPVCECRRKTEAVIESERLL